MFGGYCAEKLFRRDTSNKLKILVLEAGPLFLPTHVNNLPLKRDAGRCCVETPVDRQDAFLTDTMVGLGFLCRGAFAVLGGLGSGANAG